MRPCNMLWGRSKFVIPVAYRIVRVLLIQALITLLLLRVFEFTVLLLSSCPGISATLLARTRNA